MTNLLHACFMLLHVSAFLFFDMLDRHYSVKQVTESDAVDVVETAIKRHSSDLTSRAMCLVALLKLSSRFPSCSVYVVLLASIK